MAQNEEIMRMDLLNSILGGIICFIAAFLLSDLVESLLPQLLVYLGVIGVIAFDSFRIARAIMIFGAAHLPCGFLGGLYTGYKSEGRLNVLLLITAIVGFVPLIFLWFFLGRLSLPIPSMDLFIPALAGNFTGVYLGGYTVNWPPRGEEEELAPLTIDLDEAELKD